MGVSTLSNGTRKSRRLACETGGARASWGLLPIGIILLSILGDHLRAKNRFGDDWARFDGRQVRFVRVIDGESIAVCEGASEDVIAGEIAGSQSVQGAVGQGAGRTLRLRIGGQDDCVCILGRGRRATNKGGCWRMR